MDHSKMVRAPVNKQATSFVRKFLCRLTGKPVLSDPVRNFVYKWAWGHFAQHQQGAAVCDIGSRSSLLPAWLAWRGFRVTSVEMDHRFIDVQKSIAKTWNVSYEIVPADFRTLPAHPGFDIVSALFSLQHAGEHDREAYAHIARTLTENGTCLTVNEYSGKGTRFHTERDDGTMRIYSEDDLVNRIEHPLTQNGVTIIEKKYACMNHGHLYMTDNKEHANVSLIAAKKR